MTGYTIDEALDYIGFGAYQLMLTMIAGVGSMAEAMVVMMSTILNPELKCVWLISSWKQAILTTVRIVRFHIELVFTYITNKKKKKERKGKADAHVL